jgi:hypothetical protein
MVTDDDAMVSQFTISQFDPSGAGRAAWQAAEAVGLGIKPSKNRFAVLDGLEEASSGNAELDARVNLDASELLARLAMATDTRSKRVCQQITPLRDVWVRHSRVGGITRAELEEEFAAQESDSSDEALSEQGAHEMVDDDESGGDSEYWEAMVDSDLSDMTVRTDEEGDESSDSDFH